MNSTWWGSPTHSKTLRSVFLFLSDCTDKLTCFLRPINSRGTLNFLHKLSFPAHSRVPCGRRFLGPFAASCPRTLRVLLPAAVLRVVNFLLIKETVMRCGRWHGDASSSSHFRVRTFFHMGIFAFSWWMQCWMACWPSWRCGDEIAMTTLA